MRSLCSLRNSVSKLEARNCETMDESESKPTVSTQINVAAHCIDMATECLLNSSPMDVVTSHIVMAQNVLTGVSRHPQHPENNHILEVLAEVSAALESNRLKLPSRRPSPSPSPESLNVSTSSSLSSTTTATPDDDPARAVDALRRHVSADMGLSSVAGMAHAKRLLTEAVVMPLKYRHLFTGALRPWQSVLLYGPPGTGKTRLALAVAAEVGAELYAISPADLLSSWFGKTEQNIRELFGQLRERARNRRVIVFLDEVDGLCRRRTHDEAESTRRMKTELLTQLQEASQGGGPPGGPQVQAHLFFVCATNCPWEIDPAFLRRFQQRIFIGMPDRECRQELIRKAVGLSQDAGLLQSREWQDLLDRTEGFSGSDLADLAKNALYQPIRELTSATHWVPTTGGKWMPCSSNTIGAIHQSMDTFPSHSVFARGVTVRDVHEVMASARPTVCPEDLARYEQFTRQFGQLG